MIDFFLNINIANGLSQIVGFIVGFKGRWNQFVKATLILYMFVFNKIY